MQQLPAPRSADATPGPLIASCFAAAAAPGPPASPPSPRYQAVSSRKRCTSPDSHASIASIFPGHGWIEALSTAPLRPLVDQSPRPMARTGDLSSPRAPLRFCLGFCRVRRSQQLAVCLLASAALLSARVAVHAIPPPPADSAPPGKPTSAATPPPTIAANTSTPATACVR
jgi:hypothetical protein